MDTTSLGYQFQQLIQFMLTPLGITAMLLGPVLMTWAMVHRNARWIILAVMLWIATYGVLAPLPWFKGELLFPFQQIRVLAKSLVAAGMLMLLPVALFSAPGPIRRFPTIAATAYYAFLMLINVRLMFAGDVGRSFLAIFTHSLIFVIFGIGLSRWIQNDVDARRALKAVLWAAVALTVTSLYHVAVDANRVILLDRLFGTTANPQFMGSIMALSITPALFLLLESKESKIWRFFLCGAIGFMLACLVWTGSRTAGLMTAVSLVLFFRLRLGRMVVGIVIAGVSLWIAAMFFADSIVGAERLFSTHDTRTHVWKDMFETFLRYPLIGAAGTEPTAYQESAYLAILSSFGILGGIPFLIVMLLCFRMMVKLMRSRHLMGRDGTLADLVVAGLASMAVACGFDAYPLAMVNFHILYFFLLQAVGGMLLQVYVQPALLPSPEHYLEVPPIPGQREPEWSF